MSKILEGIDTVAPVPMNGSNGDRSVISGEREYSAGSGVRQGSFAGVAAANGTAPQATVGLSTALEMGSATRQELTKLIHRLFLSPDGSRAVAFSGVQAGAGCSWMLVRTAQLLAEADAGSVCIVDADLRNPMLYRYLSVANRPGLSDALVASHPFSEYVTPLGGQLHLLSSGSMIPKVESLLSSSAFRLRVDELRASFDFVLFDTPPLATSSDALAVASRTDGLALVVEASSTNREMALKAVKDADAAGVRMLGAVLNKRTFPIPEAIFTKL
jgi:capsular exopolysaccharide synthesis family protein